MEHTGLLNNKFSKISTIKTFILGGGFLVDSYDLFVINIVLVMLKHLYNPSIQDTSILSLTAIFGAIIGQLVFGFFGDILGRTKMFIITLSLMIVGSIASSLMFQSHIINIFISIAICRTILGIGIGGEYPLSASITADNSTEKTNKKNLGIVFSMQGIGSLLATLFALILYYVTPNLDIIWRLLLGFGAIPGLLLIYPRWKYFIKEANNSQIKNNFELKIIKENFIKLIGTAGSWFLLDVVFYSNGIFSATILKMYGNNTLLNTIYANLILASVALPGYWVGIFIVSKIKNLWLYQLVSFLILGIIFGIMALVWEYLNFATFLIMYAITFFVTNAGPNMTTYIMPVDYSIYPDNVRSSCHGISAATGKLGAFVGLLALGPVVSLGYIRLVLSICGGVSILGCLTSFIGLKNSKTNYIPLN